MIDYVFFLFLCLGSEVQVLGFGSVIHIFWVRKFGTLSLDLNPEPEFMPEF